MAESTRYLLILDGNFMAKYSLDKYRNIEYGSYDAGNPQPWKEFILHR